MSNADCFVTFEKKYGNQGFGVKNAARVVCRRQDVRRNFLHRSCDAVLLVQGNHSDGAGLSNFVQRPQVRTGNSLQKFVQCYTNSFKDPGADSYTL